MTLQHAIWTVGEKPTLLPAATLPSEQLLEQMIVAAPQMLSDEWMLIGQQEQTGHGGRIDLLAIAPDGALVLIEIKRDRTPREVVAQALDYAAWVDALQPEDIAAIYNRFAPGRSLVDDFKQRFGQPLDEEALNHSHEIVIVASALDPSSERIVAYRSKRDIPINVLCFQVFSMGAQHLLSRAWLLDPVQAQTAASTSGVEGVAEPWNGEFYASFGAGPGRPWEDARKFGFISAGGGPWYSRTLGLLKPGDRVWVKAPDYGFVGVALVTGTSEPARDFKVRNEAGELVPVLQAVAPGTFHSQFVDDPAKSEWFVPVKWLETRSLADAVYEIGLFGNQNTVCRPTTPRWRHTVETLKQRFPHHGD
jgi:hypothetical protein